MCTPFEGHRYLYHVRYARSLSVPDKRHPDIYPVLPQPHLQFSKKINFSGNTGRLGHADLACSCSGKSRSVDNWFVNKLQVRNMNLGTDDTHLYKKKAFGIGMTADSSFQIHAQYLNGISKGKILRLQLFFGFFTVVFMDMPFSALFMRFLRFWRSFSMAAVST